MDNSQETMEITRVVLADLSQTPTTALWTTKFNWDGNNVMHANHALLDRLSLTTYVPPQLQLLEFNALVTKNTTKLPTNAEIAQSVNSQETPTWTKMVDAKTSPRTVMLTKLDWAKANAINANHAQLDKLLLMVYALPQL